MPLPTIQETWTISPNNRIVYASLNQVMSEFLYGMKVFLVANGYTIKGSCDGVTGAMDAVDRWTSAASCTTRGATAAAAQSWIVLVDGQGVDILFAYQGAADNNCRLTFSDDALYVAAGTPSNQPTATDETNVFSNATDVINSTASGDRVWHGWVNSDATMFRIVPSRAGTALSAFGIEKYIPLYAQGVAVGKAFGHYNGSGQLVTNVGGGGIIAIGGLSSTRGGAVRYPPSGASVLVGAAFSVSVGTVVSNAFSVQNPTAQGSNTHIMCDMYIASAVSPLRGIIGKRIDWWFAYSNNNLTLGDFYGSSQFVVLGSTTAVTTGGVFWPWDGASSFITT